MAADKSDDTLVCNSWCPVNNWSESSTVLFIAASAILLISDDRTRLCTFMVGWNNSLCLITEHKCQLLTAVVWLIFDYKTHNKTCCYNS